MDQLAGFDVGQGDGPVHCGRCGQDRPRSEGSAAGAEETYYHLKRIGLEAGPLSIAVSTLAEAGLPVICDTCGRC
jgi:hypothetical protein